MTASFLQRDRHARSAIGRPRLVVAPFGQHTRYMLRNYGRHTFVVVIAFLAIALGIDLSPRMSRVLAAQPPVEGFAAVVRIAWYSVLRSADILTRLFPITCFLGIAWSEIAHTRSRERVIIWNSGRSPAQCLAPVLLFGVLAGAVQVSLDCYIRPVAVAAQIAARWGDYGEQLDRSLSDKVNWMAARSDILSARVGYGPPPVLHDATIYHFRPDGRLQEIIVARAATPAGELGRWRLYDSRAWDLSDTDEAQAFAAGDPTPGPEDRAGRLVKEREIALGVDPLWLTYMGIHAKLLPQDVLLALAKPHSDMYPIAPYLAWKHIRTAQAVLPTAMALFSATLSIFFLAVYGTRAEALLGIALAGYLAHLAIKVVVFLGEHDHIGPLAAAWFVPALLICVSVVILWLMSRRNFGGAHMRG